MRELKVLAMLLLVTISSAASFGLQVQPVQAQTTLVAGINYMSAGNAWIDGASTLDADFARFAGNGIKHISMRIMWSVTEPAHYDDYSHLSATAMSNYKRVLTEADKYGIRVNVDFWTQFTYTLGLPRWVGSYYDIAMKSDIKSHYVRYMQAVVSQLRSYPAVESWTILNEPFYPSSTYKVPFQNAFKEFYNAIKAVDPNHLVTCRFTLSYTPGSGKYDKSVYDIFDVFAVTEYLDPSNSRDTRYNGRWSYWEATVSDLKARGKTLWVIEFGDDNTNAEHVRKHYELSMQKFQAAGVVTRAYAWAWQTRSSSSEAFNIYSGTAPKPAYYELAKYPDSSGSKTDMEPPTAPPPSTEFFQDGFESGGTSAWVGMVKTSGETVTVGKYTPYEGDYSARFTTSGTYSGTENAYLYEEANLQQASAKGYVRIVSSSSTWLRDDGDRFYLIRLSDGSQSLAMAGVRRQGGVNRWELYAAGSYVTATKTASANTWYCVEIRYYAAQRLAELYIDGAKVLQLSVNAGGVSATHADFGVISSTNVRDGLTVYGDRFSLSNPVGGS